jgi:SAM-dependent methyltransferase
MGASKSMDSAKGYEIHARTFLESRDGSEIGAHVVEQWGRALDQGAKVLELACGGGYPITRILSASGLQLWAVDSSPTLVAEFKARFPTIPVQCARVQESGFFNRSFDGVIAIGLLFLLPEADQLTLLSRVSKALRPGGRFLFTAPMEKGEWKDLNTGLACKSLGRVAYEKHLSEVGFRVVSTLADQGANNYYDVERMP